MNINDNDTVVSLDLEFARDSNRPIVLQYTRSTVCAGAWLLALYVVWFSGIAANSEDYGAGALRPLSVSSRLHSWSRLRYTC